MPRLIWDKIDDRVYESGLDRGVLYLSDGTVVPWNGLTSVTEKFTGDSEPIYFDGRKINNLVSLGDFEATLKAITYPDEFIKLEGMGRIRNGAWLGEQTPQIFDICYRTNVGNALDENLGYKIHIIYNVIAVPSERLYTSLADSLTLLEFEWDILAIPDDIDTYRPTAHMVIDSRDFDPWLLEDIEAKLYGGEFADPALPTLPDLVAYIKGWYRWKVTDLGDGTYKLESGRGDALIFSGTSLEIFEALGIYVVDHGDGTFTVYDTYDIADIPEIKIVDNGDGTWTATTTFDSLFGVSEDGYFQIFNANAAMIAPDEYRLSDTTEG